VKGDKCDFDHIPGDMKTGTPDLGPKACDFFLSPRGCIKGDACDFLHPTTAPNGEETKRICDFYTSPRGCAKGDQCNFLHHGRKRVGMNNGMNNGRPCEFFQSPRGCIKGMSCDFAHVPAGGYGAADYSMQQMYGGYMQQQQQMGGFGRVPGRPAMPVRKRPQICDFFNQPRGCIKGNACDFIHQKQQVCQYYGTDRGCRKGQFCDFQHPVGAGSASGADAMTNGAATADAGMPVTAKGNRYKPY
jgi:hypothetical protein